jgi:chromosome segregation ATPase
MSDVYSKRGLDPKAARQNARRAMQKKQMELLDEDTKLKHVEKASEENRQELDRVKRKADQLQVELLNLEKKRSDLERVRSELEHNLANQKARIRKIEHDLELRREETYRRDVGGGTDDEPA